MPAIGLSAASPRRLDDGLEIRLAKIPDRKAFCAAASDPVMGAGQSGPAQRLQEIAAMDRQDTGPFRYGAPDPVSTPELQPSLLILP